MHWKVAVDLARKQFDVTYDEWCDLYYDPRSPTQEQIEKACETAHPILVRNNVIYPTVVFQRS